jgi:hypothetical protein
MANTATRDNLILIGAVILYIIAASLLIWGGVELRKKYNVLGLIMIIIGSLHLVALALRGGIFAYAVREDLNNPMTDTYVMSDDIRNMASNNHSTVADAAVSE